MRYIISSDICSISINNTNSIIIFYHRMHADFCRKLSYNIPHRKGENALSSSSLLQDPFFKTKSGIQIRNAKSNYGFFKSSEGANQQIFLNVQELLRKMMNKQIDMRRVLEEEIGNIRSKKEGIIENNRTLKQLKQNSQDTYYAEPLPLKSKISFQVDMQDSLDSQFDGLQQYDFQSQLLIDPRTIQALYDSPSPFIIIYSICILMKHLIITHKPLQKHNAGKLLLISILLAYKYSFDQPIQEINLHFSQISRFPLSQINKLQMKYLTEMEFRSFISRDLFLKVSDLLYK